MAKLAFRFLQPPLLSVLLAACCSARVETRMMPREDGSISAVSVSRRESRAAMQNVDEANLYYEKLNRKAVFGDEETVYQGLLTRRGGGVARIVKNIPAVGGRLTSDEDYRVTTRFKCV